MSKREEKYLAIALENKEVYEQTPWWKFKTRKSLKRQWKRALEAMVKYRKVG